jgi:hypothetical protein
MLYSLAAFLTGEISSKSEIKTQKFENEVFFENVNPHKSVLRKIKLGKISRFLNLVFSM